MGSSLRKKYGTFLDTYLLTCYESTVTIGICVVAVDGIVLAADGRVMQGDYIDPTSSSKIQKWGTDAAPFWVVSAGQTGAIQHALYEETPESPWSLARKVFHLDEDKHAEFLTVKGDLAARVGSCGALTNIDKWGTIGSGGESVEAWMHWLFHDGVVRTAACWTRLLVEEILPAASAVVSSCGPPYTSQTFPFPPKAA